MKRDLDLEATIVEKYVAVAPVLDERSRRRWAAAKSMAIRYGGDALVSSATGLARDDSQWAPRDCARGRADGPRAPSARRPGIEQDQPGIMAALEALVDPLTRGDPTSPLRWTCKSRAKLTAALTEQGWRVSSITAGRLLHCWGYRLQSGRKRREGAPGRQRAVRAHQRDRGSTSDRWRAGDLGRHEEEGTGGQLRQPGPGMQSKGTPEAVRVHDFPSDAEGKAIPYGVYDMARNEAWVSVGRDHDTPAFAVASIRHWWRKMGRRAYPQATTLYITAERAAATGIGPTPGSRNFSALPTGPAWPSR